MRRPFLGNWPSAIDRSVDRLSAAARMEMPLSVAGPTGQCSRNSRGYARDTARHRRRSSCPGTCRRSFSGIPRASARKPRIAIKQERVVGGVGEVSWMETRPGLGAEFARVIQIRPDDPLDPPVRRLRVIATWSLEISNFQRDLLPGSTSAPRPQPMGTPARLAAEATGGRGAGGG